MMRERLLLRQYCGCDQLKKRQSHRDRKRVSRYAYLAGGYIQNQSMDRLSCKYRQVYIHQSFQSHAHNLNPQTRSLQVQSALQKSLHLGS